MLFISMCVRSQNKKTYHPGITPIFLSRADTIYWRTTQGNSARRSQTPIAGKASA